MGKVYFNRIKKSAIKGMESGPMREQAFQLMKRKMQQAKQEMMADFKGHVVTQELKDGVGATNVSHTLAGYGNLFSFIGFTAGTRPTEPIESFLEKRPKVYRRSKFIQRASTADYTFRIEIPTIEAVEQLAPSPWEGRSWVRGVERGISGFGYYMATRTGALGNSRSGGGIQADRKLRALAFRPVKYMSDILKQFRGRLNMR